MLILHVLIQLMQVQAPRTECTCFKGYIEIQLAPGLDLAAFQLLKCPQYMCSQHVYSADLQIYLFGIMCNLPTLSLRGNQFEIINSTASVRIIFHTLVRCEISLILTARQ